MKVWKKAMSVAAVAMLMTTALTGCGGGKKDAPKADASEIVIGAHFELSGNVANYGKTTLNGVQMAIDEVNAKGGVLGKKIKLVQGDNKSEPSEAGNIATKLITKDKAVVLIGPATSGCVAAATPIATTNKVPLMAPVATAPGITVEKDGKVKPFVFRACFIDPYQGKVMAAFAEKTLKVKKIAILFDSSSEYSKGLSEVFSKTVEDNKGEIVAKEGFLAKDVDFKASLTKIKATNPEALYVPAYYEEVSKIIKQAREMGINCPIIGSDGWDSPKLAEIAGKAALENTYFCSAYSAQDKEPSVQNFIKTYKEKYKSDPDNFAIHGYDAAMIVVDAIKRAGSTDGTKVAEAIAKTKDLPVATGKVTLDKDHNPTSGAVIIALKGGVQTFVEKITL
jgi:branched-chain amino acid transport system substrate-binding protein